MNRYLMTTAILAGLGASPASATLQIAFSDGLGHVVTCADQQSGCDIDSGTNSLLKVFTTVGNFQVTATVATSAFGKVNNLEVTNAVIRNTGTATGTLQMVVGDTGFVSPVRAINEGASLTFNNNVGPTSSLSFFADIGDGQPGGPSLNEPGVNLFTTTGFSTRSSEAFSGNHISLFDADDPFSMAEGASLKMLGGASVTGFNQSMTTGVPEPSTWAMLLSGFALMGVMGWRRSRKGRLAPIE